jgi:protein-tyrosine phosphatase
MSAVRILAVCTGNVCRSPMTERLLQAAVGPSVAVTSAGTRALAGQDMTPETAALVRDHGGDPEHFTAQQLDSGMLRELDLVLALTREHRSAVLDLQPKLLRRSFTLLEFARLINVAGSDAAEFDDLVAACAAHRTMGRPDDPSLDDVIDPYGQDGTVYARTAKQITHAVGSIAARLSTFTGRSATDIG